METQDREKPRSGLFVHLVDSTALVSIGSPIFAGFETFVAGMSDSESVAAKITAGGLQYLGGMGWLYAKGREKWQEYTT